jgi:hypothetical protein
MRRTWSAVVLGSLIFLLTGCGGPAARPQNISGEAAVAALVPTSTPSPLPEERVATPSETPKAEEPPPTSTPLAATEESTSTSTQPPSTTPTLAPATAAPSAIPLAALTVDEIPRIPPAEAKALLDSDRAVLYDVRSTAEYQAQHAEGATSLPGASVAARYGELPTDKGLIFY